jgi:hypothetical protein
MGAKRRRWCPGKVCFLDTDQAERSRRGIVYKDARRGRLRPGVRLVCYWCEVCQAFHLGHEPVDVPPETKAAADGADTPSTAGI